MSLRSTVKELGWADGLLFIAGQMLQRLSGGRVRIVKYYLFAQPIGAPGTKPLRPDAATQLIDVPASHPLVPGFPRPAPIIAQRYARGGHCTAAMVRDEFAGFIWIQRGRYEEDEVRCTYVLEAPAVSVWDYDVYVEPKYRIGRTMARLWAHVDAALAAEGVRWSFSRISAFNAVSLASHARLGVVRCGQATFLCIGRWQCALLPQGLHGSAGRRVPELRLRPPA
jgi:hypothetical protein